MALQLEDLVALDAPIPNTSGTPLMIDLDRIDEDPEQPRREFDEATLQELAETLRDRGLRQPVSVKPSPSQPGRWLLNFGARRLRAARLAGLRQIPAFVDTTADRYDQVIENEQREGLSPLELATFVQKRLALGESQAEVGRKLGKSRQWVTRVTAMIDPPDWLLQAYREGRCRGLNELHEIRRLHALHPEAVEAWVPAQAKLTRERIEALRLSLADRVATETETATSMPGSTRTADLALAQGVDMDDGAADRARVAAQPAPAVSPPLAKQPGPATPPPERATPARPADAATPAASVAASAVPAAQHPMPIGPRVHVDFEGLDCWLDCSEVPSESGHMFICPAQGGLRRSAPVGALTLRGFEGR